MNLSADNRKTLIRHRMDQMRTAARSSRVLLNEADMQGAANRLYYSIFYAISALALAREKSFSKHGALIGWFYGEYVNTGKFDASFGRFVNTSWKNRTRGDYQFILNVTREELDDSIATLDKFIGLIEDLLKTDNLF
jgi:uncharacterized protein (UPF0332 family)